VGVNICTRRSSRGIERKHIGGEETGSAIGGNSVTLNN